MMGSYAWTQPASEGCSGIIRCATLNLFLLTVVNEDSVLSTPRTIPSKDPKGCCTESLVRIFVRSLRLYSQSARTFARPKTNHNAKGLFFSTSDLCARSVGISAVHLQHRQQSSKALPFLSLRKLEDPAQHVWARHATPRRPMQSVHKFAFCQSAQANTSKHKQTQASARQTNTNNHTQKQTRIDKHNPNLCHV